MINQLDDNDQALAHACETLRRRRAFRRAMQEQERAVNFIPCACSACDAQVSHRQYHHAYGVCMRCYEELMALHDQPKPEHIGWPTVLLWAAVAGVIVGAFAWGVCK